MIHVLMHYTADWWDLGEISLTSAADYVKRHGYEVDVSIKNPYQVYNGFYKITLYDRLRRGDIGLIMDADAIITNHEIKVEDLIDEEHDLFLSEGCNMGIFIIRKSGWSDSFITFILDGIARKEYNCEQDATDAYMRQFPDDKKIKICKHPCFNSYLSELYPEVQQPVSEQQGQWIEGKSFILHLPAIPMQKRLEIMKTVKITQ